MYTLYIGNKNYSSWSLRPWVLMRMLAIPFTERLVPFGPQPAGQSIAEITVSGKVPCLKDDAQWVWDSLAIVEYLAERHPGVWPALPAARAWARCAAAELPDAARHPSPRSHQNAASRSRSLSPPKAVLSSSSEQAMS